MKSRIAKTLRFITAFRAMLYVAFVGAGLAACSNSQTPSAADIPVAVPVEASVTLIRPSNPLAIPTDTRSFECSTSAEVRAASLLSPGASAIPLVVMRSDAGFVATLPEDFRLQPQKAYVLALSFAAYPDRRLNLRTGEVETIPLVITSIRATARGTRADNLLNPRLLEVPPDTGFIVESSVPLELDPTTIGVFDVHRAPLAYTLERIGEGLRIRPVLPLAHGEVYSLEIAPTARDTRGRMLGEQSRSLWLRVPQAGVIDTLEHDLNGDGKPDRVVVFASNRIGLLFKDGASVDLPLPEHADVRGVVIADFDRDGRADIVALGLSTDGAQALITLARNSSSNQTPVWNLESFPLAGVTLPVALRSFDLGADGTLDLVAGCLDGTLVPLANHLPRDIATIGEGENAGAFVPLLDMAVSVPALHGPLRALQMGDLNSDGSIDAVLQMSDTVFACMGKDGLLLAEDMIELPAGCQELVVFRDGGEDQLCLVADEGLHGYTLRSDKSWQMRNLLPAPVLALEAATLCDLDLDDFADVLALRNTEGHIWLSLYARVAEDAPALPIGDFDLGAIGPVNALHFAQDTDALLICTQQHGLVEFSLRGSEPPELTFDSDTVFEEPALVAWLPEMRNYVLGDFDGDGRPDVAGLVEESGTTVLRVWLNRLSSSGVLEGLPAVDARGYDRLLAFDLDRDQLSDLLLLAGDSSRRGKVLRSRGSDGFEDSPYLVEPPADSRGVPVLADFNGDGYDDLFWPTPSGAVSFGDQGRFHHPIAIAPATDNVSLLPVELRGATVAFPNERGGVDVVAVGSAGGVTRLVRYFNELAYDEESGAFAARVLSGGFSSIDEVVVGRFAYGSQGIAALVRTMENDGGPLHSLRVWADPQNPELAPVVVAAFPAATTAPRELQAIDVDLDRDEDLAYAASAEDDFLTLLVNRGDAEFSRDNLSSRSLARVHVDGPLRAAHLVDLNGDRKPDVLAQSTHGDVFHSRGH